MSPQMKIAQLDQAAVEKIKLLEKEMGVQIMAFEPGSDLAELTDEQLARIKSLEDALGVVLLVYVE
jgi:hypothetical protein